LGNLVAKQPETRAQAGDRRRERVEGGVFGAVIDDDDLDFPKGLSSDRLKQPADGLRTIVGRDDDRNRRRGH
jgi:hypothetical protein